MGWARGTWLVIAALAALPALSGAVPPGIGLLAQFPAALPEAGPGPGVGVEQECAIDQTLASQNGLAPVSNGAPQAVDGTGFNCYVLWVQPSFPFHGHIRAELEDVNGGLAFLDFDVLLLTVTEPTISQSTPGLSLGPGMTLRVAVTSNVLPVGIGTWEAGVDVGHVT